MAITHLIVDNGNYSVTVANKVVKALYDLVKALYAAVPNHTAEDCYIRGTISVVHAHPSRVAFLNEEFEDLNIEVTGVDYIDNEDSATINQLATVGDGVGLTVANAAKITSLSVGLGPSTLVDGSFFQYFTGLTSVRDGLFSGATSMTTIVLPSTLPYISQYMFQNCSSLESLVIPEGVTEILSQAFRNCSNLTSITFPNTLTSIATDAFYNCAWLTNQPNGVVYVGNVAYKYKGTMPVDSNITLAEGTTIVNEDLFSSQYRMLSIVLPGTLVKIGKTSFYNCTGLTNITLPNSLTSIDSGAFSGCSGLSSITIPNSVTSLENNTFQNCSSLSSVTLSNNLTSFGIGVFKGCTSLTGITLPNTLTKINREVFSNSGLESITIPASVTDIREEVLSECTSIASMSVAAGNTVYDSRDNCNAIIHTSTNELLYGCKNTTIPNDVTRIGNYAFKGCTGLTSIAIPNGVTTIGFEAFRGCSGLTDITIPSSVIGVENYAFYQTGKYNNASNGVFYVDGWVCGSKGYWPNYNHHITINEGTVGIANSALDRTNTNMYCIGISLPSSLKIICPYAFYATTISSITIPEGVTTIGSYAFSDSSKLTYAKLPSTLTSIGSNAFNCSSLTTVIIYKETPLPITDSYTFRNRANAKLYVPYGCAAAYQEANYWKQFKQIIEMEPSSSE